MTYTEDIIRFLRLRVEALENEVESLNMRLKYQDGLIENLEAKLEVTNTLNMKNTIYDNE